MRTITYNFLKVFFLFLGVFVGIYFSAYYCPPGYAAKDSQTKRLPSEPLLDLDLVDLPKGNQLVWFGVTVCEEQYVINVYYKRKTSLTISEVGRRVFQSMGTPRSDLKLSVDERGKNPSFTIETSRGIVTVSDSCTDNIIQLHDCLDSEKHVHNV
jgi:hypothetical protein